MTTVDVDWRASAACKGKTHLYFDDRFANVAARVCAGCPVAAHCDNGAAPTRRHSAKPAHSKIAATNPGYHAVKNAISDGCYTSDQLAAATGYSRNMVTQALALMHRNGELERHRHNARSPYQYRRP